MKQQDNHINYIEFKAKDLEAIKNFYIKAFGWKFTDYGPDYTAFADSGLEGGFEKSDDPIGGIVSCKFGRNTRNRIAVRRKTCTGDLFVSWRAQISFFRSCRQ